MNTLVLSPPAKEPLWLTAWRNGSKLWWTLLLWGVDLERQQREVEAQIACQDLKRKLELQIEVAGCNKNGRSDRWNHARFIRWQNYHAAAFELIYGKLTESMTVKQALTEGITVKQARIFSKNFHHVEYLLAKRNHIRMRQWSEQDRKRLCELLRGNDQLFSGVRRFHRMKRPQHHKLMERVDHAFSVLLPYEDD